MLVVSDTSPIRALQALGRIDLLGKMYREVLVPPSVVSELAVDAPVVGAFRVEQHAFLTIQAPTDHTHVAQLRELLDAGESEALALAIEVHADTILIDEARGRRVAHSLGLKTAGVLSILVAAKRMHHVDRVEPLLTTLSKRINFRISSALRTQILDDAGETA